jgi:hypothetical protein
MTKKINADLINEARRLAAAINSGWEPGNYADLQEAVDSSDEEESFDGSGIFTRKGNVIWCCQYGGVSRIVLEDTATAELLMEYIRETSA